MASGRKIGSGHVDGMLRSGFKELAQVLPAFPSHSVQPVEEAGIAGNPTQADVNIHTGTFKDRLEAHRSVASPSPAKDQEIER